MDNVQATTISFIDCRYATVPAQQGVSSKQGELGGVIFTPKDGQEVLSEGAEEERQDGREEQGK